MNNMDLLEKIARFAEEKTGIPAYPRTVLNVLNAIRLSKDFFWIVRYSREPFNLVVEIVKKLNEFNLVEFRDGVVLSDKGKKFLDEVKYEADIRVCDRCKGRIVLFDEILDEDVVKSFIEIQKGRPEAIQEFDQGYVTPETTLSRVAYMHYRGDLRGRDIIMIGDDDLVSIAIGLTGLAHKIAVIDIDERLTKFISNVSEEYGLGIEIYTMDLRDPLPDNVYRKFDVFQTDPLETIPGLKLFLGRGIASLKGPRCSGYFYLTLVDSSLDKWRRVQEILTSEFKVVITDIVPDFSEYINWGYFEHMRGWKILPKSLRHIPKSGWYTSTMFRIETLKESVGLKGRWEEGEDIYTDEELASA